jgi:hypothetical protein
VRPLSPHGVLLLASCQSRFLAGVAHSRSRPAAAATTHPPTGSAGLAGPEPESAGGMPSRIARRNPTQPLS